MNKFLTKKGKEVKRMHKRYEAPQVTLIGQASDVVMGSGPSGFDGINQTAPDFEFEHDWPLI
jgi:hypothetical protein